MPTWPEAFVRGRDSVLGPYADLVKPALTERFDYEGELGIVIGAGGRYIPADKALDAIAGFVVLNDASARDWQRAAHAVDRGQELRGQHADRPRGGHHRRGRRDRRRRSPPCSTAQVMQSARTSQMIVDIPSAIEFFSSFTRLAPGDVIATGTPGGVGFARQPPVWLHPGDVIEVTIEGVGTIRNRVVAEPGDRAGWRWRPAVTASPALSATARAAHDHSAELLHRGGTMKFTGLALVADARRSRRRDPPRRSPR